MKYEFYHNFYNHGKSGKQRKRNGRIGKGIMRSKLKRELRELCNDM